MVPAFAFSGTPNLPYGSWIHKGGGLGVDFIAFTALSILQESSIDVISDASVSAQQQASLWLICLQMRHLSLCQLLYLLK